MFGILVNVGDVNMKIEKSLIWLIQELKTLLKLVVSEFDHINVKIFAGGFTIGCLWGKTVKGTEYGWVAIACIADGSKQ